MNYYATTSRGLQLSDGTTTGNVYTEAYSGSANQMACYTILGTSSSKLTVRTLFANWDTVLRSLDGLHWSSANTRQIVFSESEGSGSNTGTSANVELVFKRWKATEAEPKIVQFSLSGTTIATFKTSVTTWFTNAFNSSSAINDFVLTCANFTF